MAYGRWYCKLDYRLETYRVAVGSIVAAFILL